MDFIFTAISNAYQNPYVFTGAVVFLVVVAALVDYMFPRPRVSLKDHLSTLGAKTSKRRLVILDMNNVLVYRVFRYGLDEPDKDPRIKSMLNSAVGVGKFFTWDRPGRRDFVEYCLDNFDVAVWSSAKQENVDLLCSHVFGERRPELAFEWDQTKCVPVQDDSRPDRHIFLKPVASVFAAFPGRWDEDSVLIIDDSVSKMSRNPTGSYVIADAWTPLEERTEIIDGLKPGSIVRNALEKFLEKGNKLSSTSF